MAAATKGLAAQAPDLIRERLCEPEFVERFLSALEAGVSQCDRTCMRLYAEALKLVGSQVDLAIQIVNVVGAQPGEARSAVDTVRRVSEMSQAEQDAAMVESLRARGWRCLPPEAAVNGNGNHGGSHAEGREGQNGHATA